MMWNLRKRKHNFKKKRHVHTFYSENSFRLRYFMPWLFIQIVTELSDRKNVPNSVTIHISSCANRIFCIAYSPPRIDISGIIAKWTEMLMMRTDSCESLKLWAKCGAINKSSCRNKIEKISHKSLSFCSIHSHSNSNKNEFVYIVAWIKG